MTDLGVVHGRFQVFHNDHLKYVLAAKSRCEHIVIGITSPYPARAPLESIDPHRKAPESNPFTYYERMSMISACMYSEGFNGCEFSIVPFPIESPDELWNYAPQEATYFITVYDAWGDEKAARLKNLGLRVEILWRSADKNISGTKIRMAIASGDSWRAMVPAATADYLTQQDLLARVRDVERSRA
jgi:nicotinamide mononucleotide adenylyltransferase